MVEYVSRFAISILYMFFDGINMGATEEEHFINTAQRQELQRIIYEGFVGQREEALKQDVVIVSNAESLLYQWY